MCIVDLLRELNRNVLFAMLPVLQKRNKNKNLMSYLHLKNFKMRNREFFLLGLMVNYFQSNLYHIIKQLCLNKSTKLDRSQCRGKKGNF